MEVLFQIPVESADKAILTADNKFLVFVDKNLRLERWDIEKRKPVEIKELVLRRDCWESKLSPDGNLLACIDTSTKITILDTKTGKKLFEKKNFYPLNYLEYYSWLDKTGGNDEVRNINFFRIEYSPDSRFVMFSRSSRFRFRYRIDTMTVGESENTALAVNLANFTPVEVGGNLKKLAARSYLFLDSERIIGMPSEKPDDAGIFAFPNGKKISKLNFFAHEIGRTSNPTYVIIKPLANARAGIYDINKGIIAGSMNKEDITLINNLMAFESISGKIQFREVSYDENEKSFSGKEIGAIDIPVGSLGNVKAIQISDNFNWLLLSSKTRGGMWNLATNERKSFVRGFRNGLIANDGRGIAEFPKFDDAPHSLVLMNSNDNSFTPIIELPEKGARQFGRYIFSQKSLKTKAAKKKEEQFFEDDEDLKQNVKFELTDIISSKVIWTQDFPKEAPRYSFDEYSGRLILYWKLGTDIGKAKLKESPELQKKAESLGNKEDDYLIEIVDAYAQKFIGAILLETGNGSFDVYSGKSEHNWLMLYDSEGRVLTYSINDGNLKSRFFGNFASLSPQGNYIVIENFPGEISLYDLQSGTLQTSFEISGKAVFIQFNLSGNKLFVFSDSQIAYSFDLTKLSSVQKSN